MERLASSMPPRHVGCSHVRCVHLQQRIDRAGESMNNMQAVASTIAKSLCLTSMLSACGGGGASQAGESYEGGVTQMLEGEGRRTSVERDSKA